MRYEAPETVESAAALLAAASGEARVLAGGTDLLVQMRSDVVDPPFIVDIKRIAETRRVTEEKGGWRIGAAVTGAELKEHARLKQAWPGVVEAANLIGSTQIQGRATLGGNLCNGSPAADSVPALIAAGAVATLAGPKGRRDLPVEDVMLGPRKLALTTGEFVVSFVLPPRPPRSSDAYLRFIPRTEMDIAVVGAGVSVTVDEGGTIIVARVSLGNSRQSSSEASSWLRPTMYASMKRGFELSSVTVSRSIAPTPGSSSSGERSLSDSYIG